MLFCHLSSLVTCLFLSLDNFCIKFFMSNLNFLNNIMDMSLLSDLQIFSLRVWLASLSLHSISQRTEVPDLDNSNCHCSSYMNNDFGIVARKSLLDRNSQRDSTRFSSRGFMVLDSWSMIHLSLLPNRE